MTILAVDLGSSSCKAALLAEGRLLGSPVRRDHTLLSGGDLPPDGALAVVESTIRELLARDGSVGAGGSRSVDALAVSSFLAFCFLDAEGAPVTACAPYKDPRAAGEVERLGEVAGGLATFIATTGRRPAAELAATHLLSLGNRDPGALEGVARLTSLKDLLIERFTGVGGMDLIHANYTGLFDLTRRRPWETLLRELGLPRDLLGSLQEPRAVAGYLSKAAARRLGLPGALPVVRGSIDGSTAMYGAGVLLPATATLVCGTTDVLMAWRGAGPTPREEADSGHDVRRPRGGGESVPRGGVAASGLTTNTALGGGYLIGGSTALSGGLIRQLEELFGVSAEAMEEEIAGVPAGAAGLRMLPGIGGERAPFWRPEATGELRGWRVEHRRAHFFRAGMEATAFRVARLLAEMAATGLPLDAVRLAGGGSRIGLWNRIRAAAFAQIGVSETLLSSATEATLVGSAIFSELALVGGEAVEVSRRWVAESTPVEPVDPEGEAALAAEYDRLFEEVEEGR